jgi:predicted lipid-binding transport protein (Tim44 family)
MGCPLHSLAEWDHPRVAERRSWGLGETVRGMYVPIRLPEQTAEQQRANRRRATTLIALTAGPGLVAGLLTGLLAGQLVLGLAIGVGMYMLISVVTVIVAVRIEARSSALTTKGT